MNAVALESDSDAISLIDLLLDGRLGAEDARRLESLVCERADVRSRYVRYLHQECVMAPYAAGHTFGLSRPDGAVTSDLDASSEFDALIVGAPRPKDELTLDNGPEPLRLPASVQRSAHAPIAQTRARSAKLALRTAAAVLVVVTVATVLWRWLIPPAPASPAVLAVAVDTQWGEPNGLLQPGQPLPSSPLFLKSGLAQIRLDGGVTMILQAPARFQIRSAPAMQLDLGKLTATVPANARGFTVETGSARVIDLGTEFGVSVSSEGMTQVEVFKGRVQAGPLSAGTGGTRTSVLTAGQSARVSTTGVFLMTDGGMTQHFVQSLPDVVGGTNAGASAALPTPIHRYTFNDGTARDSVGSVDGVLKGGATIADGKLILNNSGIMSRDAGVSYVQFSDRLLPASGSATLEAWFISRRTEKGSRLFDFGNRTSSGVGEQFLYYTPHSKNADSNAAISGKPPFVNPWPTVRGKATDDGKAHMIAVVIDAAAGKLHLYVDAREIEAPADLGDKTLDGVSSANTWLGRSMFDTDGGLTASIDEFRVYAVPLNAAQVAGDFRAGPER